MADSWLADLPARGASKGENPLLAPQASISRILALSRLRGLPDRYTMLVSACTLTEATLG